MSFLAKNLQLLLIALFFSAAALAPAHVWASGGHGGGEKKEAPKPDSGEGEEGGDAKSKKKKGGTETVTGGLFEGDPVYVHLKPVIFPIISDRGAEQIVVLQIDLQAKDVDAATAMSGTMPRLRDSIIRGLYGGLSDGAMRNANSLDIDKIKTNIVKSCNAVYGEGTVLDALIQAVSQRKL